MTSLGDLFSTPVSQLPGLREFGIAMALAFLLGQAGAWTYIHTHSGVSYSRAFVQSIVALTLIVTCAMMIIGNNVVVAFGLMGALSMIRFRNVLKDTRDTSFIFFAVVTGIACGTGNHQLALGGCIAFCLLIVYLHVTAFGARNDSDAFLRFQSETDAWNADRVRGVLKRHCFSQDMITQRIGESGRMELAYQLTMRDPEGGHALVEEIRAEQGIQAVTLVRQTQENEL